MVENDRVTCAGMHLWSDQACAAKKHESIVYIHFGGSCFLKGKNVKRIVKSVEIVGHYCRRLKIHERRVGKGQHELLTDTRREHLPLQI